jgi:hypothetical protein
VIIARSDRRGWGRVLSYLIVGTVLVLAAWLGRRPSTLYLQLVIAGAGLVLLVRRPALGLLGMAILSFTLPLEIGTGSAVSLTAPVLLIPVVALAWLVDGLRRQAVRLPASRTVWPLLLFVVGGLLSLLAGNVYWNPLVPRPSNLLLVQLGQWGIFALSAIIFLVAGDLGTRGRWLQVSTFAFLGVASVVVLEFYVPLLRRLVGWSDPNVANRSMFWVWLAAMSLGQLLFNRRLRTGVKVWLVLLLLGAAYPLWFQLNTWASGWVPFSVAAFAVVWLRVWQRNRVLAVFMGLISIALVVMLFPFLFQHAGGELEYERSWTGRVTLYRATLDLVKDHPILGLGPASYRHYGHTRWLGLGIEGPLWLRPNVSSHNNYLDIYAQNGLVGLALFLWFLVEVGRLGFRLMPRFEAGFARGYVNGALGGIAGTLVAMMLADWFLPFVYNTSFRAFRTSAVAWMLLGGLVALEQLSKRPRSQVDLR